MAERLEVPEQRLELISVASARANLEIHAQLGHEVVGGRAARAPPR